MTAYYYCTPEWLKECARIYKSSPDAKEKLKKLTAKMAYRIKADSSWGIERDILFTAHFDGGELNRLELVSEEDARKNSDYLMAATPQTWKKILRKEKKFLTDFMLGKIKLEMGSKVGVLGVAPHANNIVDSITSVELVFPDELSPEELKQYKSNMESFREELGI